MRLQTIFVNKFETLKDLTEAILKFLTCNIFIRLKRLARSVGTQTHYFDTAIKNSKGCDLFFTIESNKLKIILSLRLEKLKNISKAYLINFSF